MAAVHRDGDLRICGAVTIVSGQSTVTAGGQKIAVVGDQEDHGHGAFTDPAGRTVSISGKHVIIVGDEAVPDDAGHPTGQTNAQTGLSTVTIS